MKEQSNLKVKLFTHFSFILKNMLTIFFADKIMQQH